MKMMKITQWITHQINLIRAWYARRVTTPPAPPPKPKPKRQYEEVVGQFRTIRELLDGLDGTFKHLRKLKPRKSSFQRAIKKFGVYIVHLGDHENDRVMYGKLDGMGAYKLPSVLCVYWPHDVGKGNVEQFFVAIKSTRLHGVQRSPNHSYYECAMTAHLDGKYHNLGYYIAINNITHEVSAMRVPYMKRHTIRKAGEWTVFHTKEWHIPDLRSDSCSKTDGDSEEAIMAGMAERFIIGYNMTMMREYGVNIIVKKGKDRATFCVPQDRWKYFFKDRIKAKTIHGHTKPIYHSVSAHKRVTKTIVTAVKTHYRGLRHFIWGGYDIRIVMQGKDGISQSSFDLAHTDEADVEDATKYLGVGEVSKMINKLVDG